MAEELEGFDPGLDELERQHAEKLTSIDEEPDYVVVSDVEVDVLEDASILLKDTGVLLEFLSNPDFCKNITKRERVIIAKHLEKIYAMTDKLDAAVNELQEDAEDEDE